MTTYSYSVSFKVKDEFIKFHIFAPNALVAIEKAINKWNSENKKMKYHITSENIYIIIQEGEIF